MSIFTHESMTNHHTPGLLNQVSDTLHVWWDRYERRRELSQWQRGDSLTAPITDGNLDVTVTETHIID